MSYATRPVLGRCCIGPSLAAIGLALAACGGGDVDGPLGLAVVSPGTAATAVVAQGAGVAPVTPAVRAAPAATAAPEAPAAADTAAPRSITLEGCVLDRHYIPTTDTPVRALAADGRLLGNARSDERGRFTLRLPPHSEVRLQVDRPQGESLAWRTGAVAARSAICLQDGQA